jgi:hypothetical protein
MYQPVRPKHALDPEHWLSGEAGSKRVLKPDLDAMWTRDTGLFERVNYILVVSHRERAGREASPRAAVLDSCPARRPPISAGLMNFDSDSNGSFR